MSKSSLSAECCRAYYPNACTVFWAKLSCLTSELCYNVWLLFMLIANLPLVFVDAVIVRRSKQLPLEGIALTREG